jgi:hypothetical protein
MHSVGTLALQILATVGMLVAAGIGAEGACPLRPKGERRDNHVYVEPSGLPKVTGV